jgi:Outer membrane protein beta-barrel domain
MTSTIKSVRMRALVASFVVFLIVAARPASAQEPPPRIPFYVIDLHGTVPRFPSDDQALADSRGMQLGELPGSGLGVQVGLHVYPLRWRAVTFGIGGELTASRSHQTPAEPAPGATAFRPSDERFVSGGPQISFNFGTGHGWSYISGGVGLSTWALVPEGQEGFAADSERLKTVNYGGGARWFMKNHLAFSFDVRFYAINPGTPYLATGSPRTTLTIIGAGVSVK